VAGKQPGTDGLDFTQLGHALCMVGCARGLDDQGPVQRVNCEHVAELKKINSLPRMGIPFFDDGGGPAVGSQVLKGTLGG